MGWAAALALAALFALAAYVAGCVWWGWTVGAQLYTVQPTLFLEADPRWPAWLRVCVPPELAARGYARLQTRHVAVLLTVQDVAPALPWVFQRLHRMLTPCRDCTVVVYENDSRDRTRALVAEWARDDPDRRRFVHEDLGPAARRPGETRIQRIARARQKCLAAWREAWPARAAQADCVLVMDGDLVGGCNWEGWLATAALWQRGRCLFPRGYAVDSIRGPYAPVYRFLGWEQGMYDTWAQQRHADERNESLWWWQKMPRRWQLGAPAAPTAALEPVLSAYGGCGLYDAALLRDPAVDYDPDVADCEHRVLHAKLRARGAELALNRYWVVVR